MRLLSLDPTRKLTVTEQGRRDLLLRLFLDADATDIPLPDASDDYAGREVILYDRRRAAAKYLGIHTGHDSIVSPLVDFLRATPPLMPDDVKWSAATTVEAANAIRRLDADRKARDDALTALARSSSRLAITPMIDFLEDPQLAVSAHHYLSGLLGDRIAASMTAEKRDVAKGRPLFGWSASIAAEAQSDAVTRLRAWWGQTEDDATLPRTFIFTR